MNKTSQKFKISPQALFYVIIFSFIYVCIILMVLIYNIRFIPMSIFNILAQIGVYAPLIGATSGITWIILVRNQQVNPIKKIAVISLTTILSFSFVGVFYMASSIWR